MGSILTRVSCPPKGMGGMTDLPTSSSTTAMAIQKMPASPSRVITGITASRKPQRRFPAIHSRMEELLIQRKTKQPLEYPSAGSTFKRPEGYFAGKLIQKFGTAKVTLISIVLTVISLVGISFAPNLVVMMIFSIIGGYGAGAIDTGLNNYVSLHYEARHMSWLHCFWGVGVTVSPVIMSFFLGDGNWRAGYRAVAAIQAVIMLFVVLYVNRWDKLEKLSAKAETTGEESGEKQNIFKIKGVVTSILSLGLYCSMEFLLGTWGATFLVNAHSCSPEIAARWVSLYYGGIMLGRLISGFLSMRVNDKMLIRLGSAVSFAGIVLLALPLKEISFFGLLLIGTGFGPIFPSVLHIVI